MVPLGVVSRAIADLETSLGRITQETAVMIPLLDLNREAIVRACRRHGVVRLEAFGTAVTADFRPGESDVDLLVELAPMEPYARVDAYFGLLEELRTLLGIEVDLVMAGAVKNPYIAERIASTKQMLYAA
jgi:uncharacterized protein